MNTEEAERVVLATLLKDPCGAGKPALGLTAECFSIGMRQGLFNVIAAAARKAAAPVTPAQLALAVHAWLHALPTGLIRESMEEELVEIVGRTLCRPDIEDVVAQVREAAADRANPERGAVLLLDAVERLDGKIGRIAEVLEQILRIAERWEKVS